MEAIRQTENAQTLRGVACGVLKNPPLTLQGRIFFVRTQDLVILDSLESLRDVEPIHIMLEVMEGHGTTHKFIFLALFMLSLLQTLVLPSYQLAILLLDFQSYSAKHCRMGD